ncbi:hypothetical protein O1504_13665 [Bacteroides fragilis]|jgi:hypothetical protein|uniref:hypothetical protein n=1 Tax=Bacteroides fragilis TaxID=817 RepID=UPI001C73019E|nr:hypothetical protein [Bacteroides fragilis]MCM0335739.1 hypothetical protein [Bacteroides fragilis]MCS3166775.1 hypothetical protein [Bacteroides fragilis]MCZ2590846.1 hypothetical protein [Bacteroides fragilis]UVO59144.1 hypothetical protein NXW10_13180 [Bacteroides fragilis]
MEEIDLNDTVTVELTEWGAVYLNALNTFKILTTLKNCSYNHHYKTDYKEGDIYRNQLYQLIAEFKDGIRFDKPKPFNKLKKAC